MDIYRLRVMAKNNGCAAAFALAVLIENGFVEAIDGENVEALYRVASSEISIANNKHSYPGLFLKKDVVCIIFLFRK